MNRIAGTSLSFLVALTACGGATAESAGPGQAPACATAQSGRVLSLELSLQPVGEGSTPAPALHASSVRAPGAGQPLPATFTGETTIDVAADGDAAPLHLALPEHFAPDAELHVACGEGCTARAHFERQGHNAGSIDADVTLPAALGGPHHVLHVHAPAELSVTECH